jgi:hypothetical protein
VVGAVLVGTMLALAILEHLMLVLPLDTTALWRWAIRKPKATVHPESLDAQLSSTKPLPLEPHDKSLQIN